MLGEHQGPGVVTDRPVPPTEIRKRSSGGDKQILFGDLHVHTTFSLDAYLNSLPLVQGEGSHPVADACDFARFCSQLDFWSVNDHAENLTPRNWAETKESIRQCNAVTDPENPDTVAFLGWEWSQIGDRPENHYGHKNIILPGTREDETPLRPIAATLQGPPVMGRPLLAWQRLGMSLAGAADLGRYMDLYKFTAELTAVPDCPKGVHVRDLPANCREWADTPRELFAKLDQWGFETLVIPHGNTWGMYTPVGSSWDRQLRAGNHDPERQRLIEVFSGHGSSEEYRAWRPVEYDENGEPRCPESAGNYEPECRRAGEIVRERCLKTGEPESECDKRAAKARRDHLRSDGILGQMSVPGASVEDWRDSGQCADCFLPSFAYRPKGSAQYSLAVRNSGEQFRFGFIASSDSHTARPGTGYKEFERRKMTDAGGVKSPFYRRFAVGPDPGSPPRSAAWKSESEESLRRATRLYAERAASFFYTGGLAAVHARGRSRDRIWQALKRREVYGTSGPRILLWFDLLNAGEGPLPMGSETTMDAPPRFRVRAAGSFRQKPGCPEFAATSLTPERLSRLCRNECHHPSDVRRLITRIEVVRIRPQNRPDEPLDGLIEDPWKTLPCPANREGCLAEFEDPDFARDTIYYVRAIEEKSPAINADRYRIVRNADGEFRSINVCHGDYRTPYDDDCLAESEARAWSSPIFVNRRGRP